MCDLSLAHFIEYVDVKEPLSYHLQRKQIEL